MQNMEIELRPTADQPATLLRKEMFYLTHFIYGYMASDIWLRTILIVRKETRCCHIGYSFRLTARVLLYAPSHRQDSTYLCYTSRGALARTRNSSMGPPHEGSIQRPIAPWANTLTTELHLAPKEIELRPTLHQPAILLKPDQLGGRVYPQCVFKNILFILSVAEVKKPI